MLKYVIYNDSSLENSNIISFLKQNDQELLSFFNINSNLTINIIIERLPIFIKNYQNNLNQDWNKYETGYIDDETNTIHILSYNDFYNTYHKNISEEDYLKIILHELVHLINSIYCHKNYPPDYLWEGIACFLSKQYPMDAKYLNNYEDIINNKADYQSYFALVRDYLKKNKKEVVLEYLKNEGERRLK
jgi:hypothetical protein